MNNTKIIPFNYAKSTKNKAGKSVHFYLDDYQFERVWNTPERYIKMLSDFDYVYQPDFSLFVDMPYPVQLYNHYRKQWVASLWEMNEIRVIPTVGWSDERSFDFCFSGVPTNSVLSVSSVGTQRNKTAKQGFLNGYAEMVKRLKPSKVLFYGNIPEEIDRGNIVHIEPFWKTIQERVSKHGR